MAVDLQKKVPAGIDAEEGSADDFVGDVQLDLAGSAPVAVDVVGQGSETFLGDASVQDAQGDEQFLVDVVHWRCDGQFAGQGCGDGGQLRIRSGRIVGHIESESDNDAVGREFFHEDAADFFWSDEDIVRPTQACLGESESAQGGNHGESGGERKGGPSAVRRIERQDNRNP